MINKGIDIFHLVNSGELISSDKYMRFSSTNVRFTYTHRDFLYRRAEWRGIPQDRLIKHPSQFRGKTIIVGHSDWKTIGIQSLPFRFLGAKALCGINVHPWKKFSFALPLGLTNDCDDSPVHRILGNESHFLAAYENSDAVQNFDGSMYANFTVRNYPKERLPLQQLLDRLPNVSHADVDMSDKGRISYLANLRNSSLVPCPRGNGIDTHRLWETLYMGGTPVILKNRMLETLVSGLPVIVLENWNLLADQKKMEKLWEEARANELFDKLKLTFWLDKLKKLDETT
jgi:hypothetical protein